MVQQTTPLRSLENQARYEAEFFVRLVERGVVSAEQAEEDLGLSPTDRWLLNVFADYTGDPLARSVRDVLYLRDVAVKEFLRLLAASRRRAA